MSRWPAERLGQVAQVIRGVSFDKSEVVDSAASGYVPILRAGNIREALDTENDLVWVPGHKVSAAQRMQRNDVAICMSSGSADIVGKTAQLEADWHGSVGAFCAIIRFHGIHPRFGAFWLRGPGFRAWRDTQAKGANIQNLRKAELESLELPRPSLPEQERIVGILDEAEALRRFRAQTDKRTGELIVSLQQALSGAGRVTLDELCDINPRENGAKNLDAHAPVSFVAMADIDEIRGIISTASTRSLSEVAKGYTPFHEGDVLFAKITPCMENGKAAIARNLPHPVAFGSTEFHVLRPRTETSPDWLFGIVRQLWFRELAKRTFTGTAGQQRVPADFMRSVVVPPEPKNGQFAARVAEIRELDTAQAACRKRLDGLSQCLLHLAFRGEL